MFSSFSAYIGFQRREGKPLSFVNFKHKNIKAMKRKCSKRGILPLPVEIRTSAVAAKTRLNMADRGAEYLYNLGLKDKNEHHSNAAPAGDIEKVVQPYLDSAWEEETFPRVRLMTLNMCMELNTMPNRLEVLGKLVANRRPDFIALQSVTTDSLRRMAAMPWCAPYRVSTSPRA